MISYVFNNNKNLISCTLQIQTSQYSVHLEVELRCGQSTAESSSYIHEHYAPLSNFAVSKKMMGGQDTMESDSALAGHHKVRLF